VASYVSVRGGSKAANERLPAGAAEALNHQDSLILSTPTNILLLGTDHANQPGHEGQRSDSIMLIRTDPSRHRVAYLSIPRDLRVPIEGVGDTKINAAMQSGGAPLAIKTIRAYTGLPINHVITVDFSQFRDVIDALGGITVDVPERIVSKFDCPLKTNAECDRWPGWRFVKGPQHMSGKRALIYSRVRKNLLNPADTDITRTEHQQDVLRATLRKMTSVSTLGKLPFIGSDLVKPLATDLSTFQFLQMGWVYKRGHELHCRLGGTPETLPDGESVIVAEGDDKERVIQAMLGRTAPLPPRPGESEQLRAMAIAGYSLAFSGDGPLSGDLRLAFLSGVGLDAGCDSAPAFFASRPARRPRVVGGVEARALEVDGDRVQNDLDRALTADWAVLRRRRVDRLEHLEKVPVGTTVLVRRHESRLPACLAVSG
jgi:LCP family protein required for cell wall assembly